MRHGWNLRPPVKIPARLTLPEIESATLANGLEVLCLEDATLPIITIVAVVNLGYDNESRDRRGLLDLLTATLARGSRQHSAEEITEKIEQIGASLGVTAGQETLRIGMQMLSRDLEICLDVLCELLLAPRYADDELTQARRLLVEQLQAVRSDARRLADIHLETTFWTEGHPRGWPLTAQTAHSVSRADLLAMHDRFFRPSNTVITVAGAISAEEVHRLTSARLAGWTDGVVPAPPQPELPDHRQLRWLLVDKPDQSQAHIELGSLGYASGDPLYPAASVVDYIAGSGFFSSRLMRALRSEAGLCYHIDSSLDELREPGAFKVTAITRNDCTVVAIDRIISELERMRSDGVSDQELDDARSHLYGAVLLDLQSAGAIMHHVVSARHRGHSHSWLQELPRRIVDVSHRKVLRVARQMLDPSGMAGVIVGRAEEIRPLLDAAGYPYSQLRCAATEPF